MNNWTQKIRDIRVNIVWIRKAEKATGKCLLILKRMEKLADKKTDLYKDNQSDIKSVSEDLRGLSNNRKKLQSELDELREHQRK
ncbi:hypothetical protein ES703_79009 [subsurface metagenome]